MKLLEISGGAVAMINDADFVRASTHKWQYYKQVFTKINKRVVFLSRYIMCESDPRVHIYYKNGDRFNCTRSNLTTKRGETREGIPRSKATSELLMEIERIREMAMGLEMGSVTTVASGKLRDRITRAEAILKGGDKMEMQKYIRILKKVR